MDSEREKEIAKRQSIVRSLIRSHGDFLPVILTAMYYDINYLLNEIHLLRGAQKESE